MLRYFLCVLIIGFECGVGSRDFVLKVIVHDFHWAVGHVHAAPVDHPSTVTLFQSSIPLVFLYAFVASLNAILRNACRPSPVVRTCCARSARTSLFFTLNQGSGFPQSGEYALANMPANFIIRISHQKSATRSFGHICIRHRAKPIQYTLLMAWRQSTQLSKPRSNEIPKC